MINVRQSCPVEYDSWEENLDALLNIIEEEKDAFLKIGGAGGELLVQTLHLSQP